MKIIVILFLFISTTVIGQEKTITLSGEIKGLNNREVVLLNQNREPIVRTAGNGDKFEMQPDVIVGDGRFYVIYIPDLGDLGPSMKIPTIYLFLDTENIEIRAQIIDGSLEKTAILGSPMMDEYEKLHTTNPLESQLTQALEVYNKAFHEYNLVEQTDENMKALNESSKKLDELFPLRAQAFIDMIPENKNNIALAAIIQSMFFSSPQNKLEQLYQMFDKDIHDSYPLAQIKERIGTIQSSSVGNLSPEFKLKDENGNEVSLSSLKGNFVLIDFWASWCGPCRKEIPNIKKVHEEYKNKNLTVVGISIDNDEKKWRKALEEENMDYIQLYDPEMSTGKTYNYQGIPFIVLISPDGKILERGLRGENIGTKLKEYID